VVGVVLVHREEEVVVLEEVGLVIVLEEVEVGGSVGFYTVHIILEFGILSSTL